MTAPLSNSEGDEAMFQAERSEPIPTPEGWTDVDWLRKTMKQWSVWLEDFEHTVSAYDADLAAFETAIRADERARLSAIAATGEETNRLRRVVAHLTEACTQRAEETAAVLESLHAAESKLAEMAARLAAAEAVVRAVPAYIEAVCAPTEGRTTYEVYVSFQTAFRPLNEALGNFEALTSVAAVSVAEGEAR